MSGQKTAYLQYVNNSSPTGPLYQYYPAGSTPGAGWSPVGIAFQLWNDDGGTGRMPVYRGTGTAHGVPLTALGTTARLESWGFTVDATPVGYATEPTNMTAGTTVLRMASEMGGKAQALAEDDLAIEQAWATGVYAKAYSNMAVPRINRAEIFGGWNAAATAFEHAVVSNNITDTSERSSGGLDIPAGGGLIEIAFRCNVEYVAGSLAIIDTSTGRGALGDGLEFQLIDERLVGTPDAIQTLVLHDDGLAEGTNQTKTYEWSLRVTFAGNTYTIDPKIINRSNVLDT